jgi:hypothetical protein
MRIILAHDHYDGEHLVEVAAQMSELGAPTIRAIWVEAWDAWVALEGCHRIRAASGLGIIPIIKPLDYDEVADWDLSDVRLGLDMDNPGSTVGWLVDGAYHRATINFAD